jgi:hypothetical protein
VRCKTIKHHNAAETRRYVYGAQVNGGTWEGSGGFSWQTSISISKLEARYVEPSFRASGSLLRHFLLLYHCDGSKILSTSSHNVLMVNIQKETDEEKETNKAIWR